MGSDILAKIVAHKRTEIAAAQSRARNEDWARRARDVPLPPDFLAALAGHDRIRIIAELKRASPSAGLIRPDFDPRKIARSYASHGAACLSVLTDAEFFEGSIEHLRAVCGVVDLPILRKDFVLDPVQVYEAKIAGASAVLLIAECLEADHLAHLVELIGSLEMTALVEFHHPENLLSVLQSGARLIGINNRDLRTSQTDLGHTLELIEKIPVDRTVVSESGIRCRNDVLRLEQAGVAAILVGETFLRAEDPGRKLAEFLQIQDPGP